MSNLRQGARLTRKDVRNLTLLLDRAMADPKRSEEQKREIKRRVDELVPLVMRRDLDLENAT